MRLLRRLLRRHRRPLRVALDVDATGVADSGVLLPGVVNPASISASPSGRCAAVRTISSTSAYDVLDMAAVAAGDADSYATQVDMFANFWRFIDDDVLVYITPGAADRLRDREFLFMSNHYHLLITDLDGCTPDTIQDQRLENFVFNHSEAPRRRRLPPDHARELRYPPRSGIDRRAPQVTTRLAERIPRLSLRAVKVATRS